jgi:formylmethanofuran dehydrogenase subunit E
MHAETITTTPTTATITTQTPADLLSEAQMLVASAFRRADDESNDYLSWADRDRICRSLNDALRLMREVREAITFTEPDDETETITCSECGDEVDEDQAWRGECLTCAYYYAQANAF